MTTYIVAIIADVDFEFILGGIQYLRKQAEVGGWLVNCLLL